MYHQNLAISWRMLYDRDPEAYAANMERVAASWRDALATAREISHTDYIRYCQGRLLETLAAVRPLDDPEITALREMNDKEVPWKGPVNDFFTAEAVAGELACRLAEGDNAGARILAEMALPYYEGSTYLSDFQRAVDVWLKLAAALNRPLVAVYGSTSPGFTPPLAEHVEIVRLGLDCSPCFDRTCRFGHYNCLRELMPQPVVEALQRLQGSVVEVN